MIFHVNKLIVLLLLLLRLYQHVFSASENRPARKDYNKLSGSEDQSKSGKNNHATSASEDGEHLDNQESYEECSNHTPGDSDTDSSFTDIEMDNRDDFSDDSDYGESLIV
nr:unnamed protein product [Callosobruchus chinensis]